MPQKPERQAPGRNPAEAPGKPDHWEYNPVAPPEWKPAHGEPGEWRPSEPPRHPANPQKVGDDQQPGRPIRSGEYFSTRR